MPEGFLRPKGFGSLGTSRRLRLAKTGPYKSLFRLVRPIPCSLILKRPARKIYALRYTDAADVVYVFIRYLGLFVLIAATADGRTFKLDSHDYKSLRGTFNFNRNKNI